MAQNSPTPLFRGEIIIPSVPAFDAPNLRNMQVHKIEVQAGAVEGHTREGTINIFNLFLSSVSGRALVCQPRGPGSNPGGIVQSQLVQGEKPIQLLPTFTIYCCNMLILTLSLAGKMYVKYLNAKVNKTCLPTTMGGTRKHRSGLKPKTQTGSKSKNSENSHILTSKTDITVNRFPPQSSLTCTRSVSYHQNLG